MPDARINDLPVIPAYDDDDRVPLVDQSEGVDGTTSQTTLQNYENARIVPLTAIGDKAISDSFIVETGSNVTQGQFVSLTPSGEIVPGFAQRYATPTLITPVSSGLSSNQTFGRFATSLSEDTVLFVAEDTFEMVVRAATISGNTITNGTATNLDMSAVSSNLLAFFKLNNNLAVLVGNIDGTFSMVAITVTGTSISSDIETVVLGDTFGGRGHGVALNNTRGVLCYRDASNVGRVRVFDYISNSFSLGTLVSFGQAANQVDSPRIIKMNESKIVWGWRDINDNRIRISSATVDGTTITLDQGINGIQIAETARADDHVLDIAYIDEDRFLLVYISQIGGVNDIISGRICTISDKEIVLGDIFLINDAEPGGTDSNIHVSAAVFGKNRALILHSTSSGVSLVVPLLIRGTRIFAEAAVNFTTVGGGGLHSNDFCMRLTDTKGIVNSQTANTFAEDAESSVVNFNIPLGIAQTTATSGNPCTVDVKGISDVHSSLIPGQQVYADSSGNLSQNDISRGVDKPVGIAISATEILITHKFEDFI